MKRERVREKRNQLDQMILRSQINTSRFITDNSIVMFSLNNHSYACYSTTTTTIA